MLRICAALSLVVWIAASGLCSFEHLLGHAESNAATSATDSGEAGHSHDSNKHDDGEHSCCNSLKATPQLGGSIVVNHPDFGRLFWPDFFSPAQTLTFIQPEVLVLRQPRSREWIFTPEVYLGPAHRNHAPPFVV